MRATTCTNLRPTASRCGRNATPSTPAVAFRCYSKIAASTVAQRSCTPTHNWWHSRTYLRASNALQQRNAPHRRVLLATKSRKLAIAAVALLLVLIGGGALVASRDSSPSLPSPSAQFCEAAAKYDDKIGALTGQLNQLEVTSLVGQRAEQRLDHIGVEGIAGWRAQGRTQYFSPVQPLRPHARHGDRLLQGEAGGVKG